LGIEVFANLHFLPGKNAEIARLSAVFSAEREVRIADRLQPRLRDRPSVPVADFDDRIEPAVEFTRIGFDDPSFAGIRREGKPIFFSRGTDRPFNFDAARKLDRRFNIGHIGEPLGLTQLRLFIGSDIPGVDVNHSGGRVDRTGGSGSD
jgi:hypothetical protein